MRELSSIGFSKWSYAYSPCTIYNFKQQIFLKFKCCHEICKIITNNFYVGSFEDDVVEMVL